MSDLYINKFTIHQRGGSIDIDNSTNKEQVHISHRSGSNVNFTNVVTSELATNNKQLNVLNDSYTTIGGDSFTYVGGQNITRTSGSSITLNGFSSEEELQAYTAWKETYRPIALANSQFKIKRGGVGYPNGAATDQQGNRAGNPTLRLSVVTVENTFGGYSGIPIINATTDEVGNYDKVINRTANFPAEARALDAGVVEEAAGASGSKADGVMKYGASVAASTEQGSWSVNDNSSAKSLASQIEKIQPALLEIERGMGDGGDGIDHVKRDKTSIVGGVFNDYPAIRIDEEGRIQPHEVVVGVKGAFENYDYAPVVEDIDNSSIFPGGTYNKTVNNQYNITVGAGGYNLKTVGNVEFGGSTFKCGFQKISIAATHGIHIVTDKLIEISAAKSVVFRTNRQVMVEGAFGVKNNTIIGGGLFTEGEVYVNHITAPLEVQQTEETIVYAKFNTKKNRSLVIGEVYIDGWRRVYALSDPDLIILPPHSHHFNNIPLRLMTSNADVRKIAQIENINNHGGYSAAREQKHERKIAQNAI